MENVFVELDLASITWWATDKIRIAKGYMAIMTGFFLANVICILAFNTPPLSPSSYVCGFIGYVTGYYLETMVGEVIRLFRKLFKKE